MHKKCDRKDAKCMVERRPWGIAICCFHSRNIFFQHQSTWEKMRTIRCPPPAAHTSGPDPLRSRASAGLHPSHSTSIRTVATSPLRQASSPGPNDATRPSRIMRAAATDGLVVGSVVARASQMMVNSNIPASFFFVANTELNTSTHQHIN